MGYWYEWKCNMHNIYCIIVISGVGTQTIMTVSEDVSGIGWIIRSQKSKVTERANEMYRTSTLRDLIFSHLNESWNVLIRKDWRT
jgi:hypothetical protein